MFGSGEQGRMPVRESMGVSFIMTLDEYLPNFKGFIDRLGDSEYDKEEVASIRHNYRLLH